MLFGGRTVSCIRHLLESRPLTLSKKMLCGPLAIGVWASTEARSFSIMICLTTYPDIAADAGVVGKISDIGVK
jgi:hypothetical protein